MNIQRQFVNAEMEKNRITEFKKIDSYSIFEFPFSALKVVGGIQLGLGITCVILGVINVVTFAILNESPSYTDDNLKLKHTLAIRLALSSTSIWCGIWFCLSGVMALNISKNNMTSIYCFKMLFLVLSLLCAVLFGPTSLGVNAYEAMLRHDLYGRDYKWLVPLLTAFCALNEIVFAIVSAIVCCCFSPIKDNKVRVFYARDNKDRQENSTFQDRQVNSTIQDKKDNSSFQIGPTNAHLQTRDFKEPKPLWRDFTKSKVEPLMFKPFRSNINTRRTNFTAEHLKQVGAW